MKTALFYFPAFIVLMTLVPAAYAEYWHGDFTDDSTLVFSEEAFLFTSPDQNSQPLMEVPRTTTVTVTGMGKEAPYDGSPTYWYPVSVSLNGETHTGHMPGFFLAMTFMDLGEDTLFMYNVTSYDSSSYGFNSAAEVLVSGETADRVSFSPVGSGDGSRPYSYSVRALELDNAGLEGVRNLMELSFIYEACGYMNQDLLLAWTGNHLMMGPNADSQFEAAAYRYIETFVLPGDEGGEENVIGVEAVTSEWAESIQDYEVTNESFRYYSWNGSQFSEEDAVQ
ncbi:MAG: hypothetical protein GF388_03640 [Candidatus Aegiribacteria sp.]|nr:hypothetical protein [Candidatus Aegiribacteria sp.]MBD3294356.1 hypothetical protein [Candidatus Fermentibacteria bacterium]